MSDELVQWLDRLGLGKYTQVFVENDIDLEVLHHLSDDDFEKLGLSLGHQRKIQVTLKEQSSRAPLDVDIQSLKKRVAYLGDHGLLTFDIHRDAEAEAMNLAFAIGDVDKRAHRQLRVGTREWEDVIMLLVNAISIGIEGAEIEQGKKLCSQANELLEDYIRAKK